MNANKKYYKDVVRLFPIHSKKERVYLQNLKEQIDEYEDITYDDLVLEFGSPIDIVKAYYDTINSQYLLKKLNLKRIVLLLSISIIILVMTVSFYSIYLFQKAYEDFHTGIPAEIEEVVEVIQ